jgi:phytoene dehydrogenase-like protein
MNQLVKDWDDSVLDYYDWTPLDNWRLNRSAKFGQVVDVAIIGGGPNGLTAADTRTPVPGFYLGGGGVHPGVPGLLGAGMLAARAVSADRGLPDPPAFTAMFAREIGS